MVLKFGKGTNADQLSTEVYKIMKANGLTFAGATLYVNFYDRQGNKVDLDKGKPIVVKPKVR